MKITVGFITTLKNECIHKCIDTVYLQIPNVEVIVVGGENTYDGRVAHIKFDDTIKKGWVTKKKNIITAVASGEVIAYCHDYFMFLDGWFDAWNKFGWDWDYACNRVEFINGMRDYDLISWDHPTLSRYTLMDYSMVTKSDLLTTYISGGYMLAKKKFMTTYPFNEELSWGMSEDVEWSLRVRGKGTQAFNKDAVVRHNKIHIRLNNFQ